MHVTRMSRYMTLYIAFGIICGRSWNVLPADKADHLYRGVYGIRGSIILAVANDFLHGVHINSQHPPPQNRYWPL